MKSSGILMSGEMVRAYLAGQKNQTRRTRGLALINQAPDDWRCDGLSANGEAFVFTNMVKPAMPQQRIKPPYGYVGDELWFKETWAASKLVYDHQDQSDVIYRANDWTINPYGKWRPSIFMPRWANRIVTGVTGVRVERLGSISDADCLAEGIVINPTGFVTKPSYGYTDKKGWKKEFLSPKAAYWDLVDSLNPKTLPAMNNHWVWVYEFPYFGGEEAVANG